MLPEVGAAELIVIAAVALIVVGPKDLPVLMRKIGGFMTRMRGLAAEFRASFDEMARQSELDDLRKEVEALRRGTTEPVHADLEGTFRAIDQDLAMPGLGGEAPLTPHADEAALEAAQDIDLTTGGEFAPEPRPEPQPEPQPEPRREPETAPEPRA
jgi:sec-independent protein translocase protein TatB